MSMKKTDLEKFLAKKLGKGGATPDRYGKGAARHAKGGPRDRDKDAVPLALKLLGKKP